MATYSYTFILQIHARAMQTDLSYTSGYYHVVHHLHCEGGAGMGMMTMIGWSNQCQTDKTVKMVKYELVSQIYFIMLIQCLSVCLSIFLLLFAIVF